MLSASLGTTSSGSNSNFSPSPSQAGHAPCGALKLNSRGSISDMVKPETGQANFSEKTMRPGGALSDNTARSCAASKAAATPMFAVDVWESADSAADVLGPSAMASNSEGTINAACASRTEALSLGGEGWVRGYG